MTKDERYERRHTVLAIFGVILMVIGTVGAIALEYLTYIKGDTVTLFMGTLLYLVIGAFLVFSVLAR